MQLQPIINSLVENDAYKFNMQNIVSKKFSDYTCEWTFKCRNDDVVFKPEMVKEIRDQVDHYCTLRFKDDDIEYLRTAMPWLSTGYLNFLKFWHPERREILVNEGNIQPYNGCGLAIESHGTWLSTMMYEIAILAIVNEVYYAFKYGDGAKDIVFQQRTMDKFKKLRAACDHSYECYSREYEKLCPYEIGVFAEFGMRRRLSSRMQDWLIKFIVDSGIPGFVGTSNVHLARKYGVKPIGTMAHEFIMAIGQGNPEVNPAFSNKFAMEAWTDEYATRNGIVLGDTIKTDLFLKDFGLKYATLFSGVRHDSGDPIAWGEKILSHYDKLGINPATKTLLFSDSLNFEKATELRNHFCKRCNVSFGIGTYLANDTDVDPINIVMKLTKVNGLPVAKISDTPGKGICIDSGYVDYLNRTLEWRMTH